MKPVLASWPAKKRTLAFAPFAAGIALVAFVILALATQNFFLTVLLAPTLGVASAWALVGWPELVRKSGAPLVDPKVKPYLFFAIAPVLALLLYPIFGVALTQVGIPVTWIAYASMTLAAGTAGAVAYFLVGFPHLIAHARHQYAQIPPERRPYLFFPVFVLFFLTLYIVLGVATTRLIGSVEGDPTAIFNLQVLILLPLCMLLAGIAAWLLVGFPPVAARPLEHLPKVTGRHRPRVFLATILLAGIPFTVAIGALLTGLVGEALPGEVVLPLAVLLGFALSLGLAALVWGTPAKWRRFEDYEPGIPARWRIPLFAGAAILTFLAVAVGIGLAGLDLFWGILVGLFAGASVFLVLTGLHKRVLARRNAPTLVPDLPDAIKPVVLLTTWFLVAGVLFAMSTYLLPGAIAWNAAVSTLVGLLLSVFLLEQPLLKDVLRERREERERRKAWEARRKERLRQQTDESVR